MRETPRDEHFPNDPKGHASNDPTTYADDGVDISGELVGGSPTEGELVIISLLMRLYDVQLAILNEMNEDRANEVFDHHDNGGHFNPKIFIPTPATVVTEE